MNDISGEINDLDADVRKTVRMTIGFMEVLRNRSAPGTSYVPRSIRRVP
jgi:hypothetical protein